MYFYLKSFLKNLLIERFCFLTFLSISRLTKVALLAISSSTWLTNFSAFTKDTAESPTLISVFFGAVDFLGAAFFAGAFFAGLFLLTVFLDLLLSVMTNTLVDGFGSQGTVLPLGPSIFP